jgi:hypothetical protein
MDTKVTVWYDGGEVTVEEQDFRRADRGLHLTLGPRTELLIPEHSVRSIRVEKLLTEVNGEEQ